ncbi:putative PAS sensor signal transduction histidine kinase [Methanocella conradii HZ254]|uniref:histidine kinase n=1 Tax=Methanocella conradii (strain DSM 24694 / JCM 17849 / CGMCC 1.5162 / HZ254) TaxID=1041930 RepID=H8I6B8_METCZ|nr:HAMP domain-containing sensor histidine kinase [Methanocella conradii]AFD01116.1 putative PAS sensor signal transduction histidine kinase [Methanocella conradii HZ254]
MAGKDSSMDGEGKPDDEGMHAGGNAHRLEAENALRESEAKFRAVFDYAVIGIALADAGKRITACNRALERIAGYSMDELRSMSFTDLSFRDDVEKDLKLYEGLVEGAIDHYQLEKRFVRKDGRVIWGRLIVSSVVNSAGDFQFSVSMLEDINERKRWEEVLSNAKNEAELYVDLMGHDINNMNQITMGYLELARDIISHNGVLGMENASLLDKAYESLQNSSRLIDSVRKLQRGKAGFYPAKPQDIDKVLGEVVGSFKNVHGRDVRINYAPCGSLFVNANDLLKDVFDNLIGNSIKHSRGPLTVNVNASVEFRDGRSYCKVIVEDNGPGIPDSLKSSLFGRLNLATTRARGKGFGLCLTKMLVDDYGGQFWVEDRVEGDHSKGCRFVVLLPMIS